MGYIRDWIIERIAPDIYRFNLRLIIRCIGLLKRYSWRIFCIIVAVVIFTILSHVELITNPDNARYILSAISQSLAAILALVFTITLVVAQMTRRYTAMDKIVFRYETIVLMVIFGIGIITPLLVLKFGLRGDTVNLSIAIASFCVFSLIPFLKGVNGVLKYDVGLENLIEEIMEALESEQKVRTDNRVKDLIKLGVDAVDEFRDDTLMNVIFGLERIEENIRTRGWDDIRLKIIGAMGEIGIKAAKNMWMYRVRFILYYLGKVGVGTIDYPQKTSGIPIDNETSRFALSFSERLMEIGLMDWVRFIVHYLSKRDIVTINHPQKQSELRLSIDKEAIERLMEIGVMSGNKRLGRPTGARLWGTPIMEAAYWVKEMDVKAIKKFEYCLWISDGVAYLWILGACAMKYLPENSDFPYLDSSNPVKVKATDFIAIQLKELQQQTDMGVIFEDARKLCRTRFFHLNLLPYLEKFKKLYDKKDLLEGPT